LQINYTMKSYKAKSYNGEIYAPASKSYLQRAIAIAVLSEVPCKLKNISWCNDTLAAKKIAEDFGADIIEEERSIVINPGKFADKEIQINCGFFTCNKGLLLLSKPSRQ